MQDHNSEENGINGVNSEEKDANEGNENENSSLIINTDNEPLLPATSYTTLNSSFSSSPAFFRKMMRCNCRREKTAKLTDEQRLHLNWLQKWFVFGKFPWKFVIHALITLCCTAVVFVQTVDQTPYTVDYELAWYNLFFPSSYQYVWGADNYYNLFTIQDTLDTINNAMINYQQFPNQSVNWNQHRRDGMNVTYLAKMTVQSYADCKSVFEPSKGGANVRTVWNVYDVNLEDLGPLSNKSWADLKIFFYCMQTMSLKFQIYNVHLDYTHPLGYLWTIVLYFDNTVQGGSIVLTMTADKTRVSTRPYVLLLATWRVILDILLIFLALASQILSWVSLSKSFHHFQRTRKIIETKGALQVTGSLTWKKLPFRTKLRFFNMWFFITIIGNVCNIAGALYDLIVDEEAEVNKTERFLIALGTLLAWINMVRYLEFDKKYTVLISTLQRGIPNIIRFIVGVLPIFMGFALFGLLYFSEISSRFQTFGEVCVTLLGLQLGDDIQAVFRDSEAEVIVSRIYLISFIFISIYAIANIFIAIMEEAFSFSTQEEIGKTKDMDIRSDSELWNAILDLDSPRADGFGSVRRRVRITDRSPPPSPPPDLNTDVNVGQEGADLPENEEFKEIWGQISTMMDEQHTRMKAETENRIKQLLNARMRPQI